MYYAKVLHYSEMSLESLKSQAKFVFEINLINSSYIEHCLTLKVVPLKGMTLFIGQTEVP